MSTAEVASELSKCSKIAEANVYGVKVPGEEGRAGCAGTYTQERYLKNEKTSVLVVRVLNNTDCTYCSRCSSRRSGRSRSARTSVPSC